MTKLLKLPSWQNRWLWHRPMWRCWKEGNIHLKLIRSALKCMIKVMVMTYRIEQNILIRQDNIWYISTMWVFDFKYLSIRILLKKYLWVSIMIFERMLMKWAMTVLSMWWILIMLLRKHQAPRKKIVMTFLEFNEVENFKLNNF